MLSYKTNQRQREADNAKAEEIMRRHADTPYSHIDPGPKAVIATGANAAELLARRNRG